MAAHSIVFVNSKTKAARLGGAVLLLASGLMAFAWFVWLEPVKRVYSPSWWERHSKRAYWEEAQESVARVGVTHDVGIDMGRWGDKTWAIWIIHHIKPGQDIMGCEASHLGEALADITNHQLKPDADIWLGWWKTNQDKTQVEWIREGFVERGLILQEPLTTNNIIDLLKLANLATNSPVYINTPDYLRGSLHMNAFRWLRDSGITGRDLFRLWNFDADNIPEANRNQIITAMLDYAVWYGEHWNDPGHLSIANRWNYGRLGPPWFLEAKFRWTLYGSMTGLALAGIWLMRRRPLD
jgi:hypothetical protein